MMLSKWLSGGRPELIFAFFAMIIGFGGCLAERRCLSSDDCPSGKQCRQGECVWGCSGDEDCQNNYTCKDHRCVLPAGCQGCFFPHAGVECDEESCSMGQCEEGYYDIDGVEDNGCEYACVPTSEPVDEEALCNEIDDDCDGVVDEGFKLQTDPRNCGECGLECPTPDHAVAVCAAGQCRYDCEDGWFDNNGDAYDGCESEECIPIVEPTDQEPNCDNIDDDCDGEVDEGFDKTLPETCGTYCVDCFEAVPNATPQCFGGECIVGTCNEGFVDVNESPDDGCECEITNGGVEICDGLDNDCNGAVDDSLNCCPPGMVQVDPTPDCVPEVNKPFCVDKYEASLWNSPECDGVTGEGAGQNPADMWNCDAQQSVFIDDFPLDVGAGGTEGKKWYACSLPEVYPARCVSWYQAKRACENSGKRLCSAEEWTLACQGTECFTYPFGNDFVWDVCNYIQTFEDFFRIVETGAMTECESGFGAFDISGNVWEMDASGNGHARGGAFNCNAGSAETLESCEHSQPFMDLTDDQGNPTGFRNNVGFRCCK